MGREGVTFKNVGTEVGVPILDREGGKVLMWEDVLGLKRKKLNATRKQTIRPQTKLYITYE